MWFTFGKIATAKHRNLFEKSLIKNLKIIVMQNVEY